jgi:hypothetical protein
MLQTKEKDKLVSSVFGNIRSFLRERYEAHKESCALHEQNEQFCYAEACGTCSKHWSL